MKNCNPHPSLNPLPLMFVMKLTNLKCFQWGIENKTAPMRVVTLDIIKWGRECKAWLQGHKNRFDAKNDLVHKHSIKQHSIMFKLPYWEVHSHGQNIESQIFDFLVSTIVCKKINCTSMHVITLNLLFF
jgi:hypothetical protein